MSTTNGHAKIIIPSQKVREERQRHENECASLAHAADICYDADTDTISLVMRSGITLAIPRSRIDELVGIPRAELENELTLRIGGEALSLPSLDIDIAIPGLLRDLFGLNIQRAGGRARSEAKAAASRANGAKGGRPRKKHAA